MDFKKLAENLDIEEKECLELVALFIEVAASDLHRFQEALEEEDVQEAARAAHSIKGAAANLGLGDIFEVSKTMEKKALDKNLKGAMEMVRTMKEKLDGIAQNLTEG